MHPARSARGRLRLVSGESSENQSAPDYYLGKNQEIDYWRVHSLLPGFSTEARFLHWWNRNALPLPATPPVFRVGWFLSTLKASIRPRPRSYTPIMIHKLENYLRTYRKKSGLTQREVAFLLGCQNGAQVSRYEKRRRLPPPAIASLIFSPHNVWAFFLNRLRLASGSIRAAQRCEPSIASRLNGWRGGLLEERRDCYQNQDLQVSLRTVENLES